MPISKLKAVNDQELEQLESTLASTPIEEPEVTDEDSTSSTESAPVETKSSEAVEDQSIANTEEDELAEDEVTKLSEKAQRRFRKLSEEIKSLTASLETYKTKEKGIFDMLDTPNPSEVSATEQSSTSGFRLPWEKYEGGEINLDDYKRDVELAASKIIDEKLSKSERNREIIDRLKTDISVIKSLYPELDDSKPFYDEGLSVKIASYFRPLFDQARSKGEYFSFRAFAEDIMGVRELGKKEAQNEIAKKVTRQVAEQPISSETDFVSKERSTEDLIAGAKTFEDLEKLEKLLR